MMKTRLTEKAACLRRIMDNCHKIVTVTHTHPDGDAIGSSIGTACWCESLGKEVTCIFPDPVPDTISFIFRPERQAKCLTFSKQRAQAEKVLEECDLIIALDFSEFSRTEEMAPVLKASPKRKVQIDHHLNPATADFELSVSEINISSASELSYQLLKILVGEGYGSFSMEACEAFMTGMTTDTNNFANSTLPSTLEMASELLEAGVNRDKIIDNLYWHYAEGRLRALGLLLKDKMTITPEGAAYMMLRDAEVKHFNLGDGDTEGFVNIPLAIEKVRMSIFLKEADGHFRVSIRSKKGTSASIFANKYFHGGGHENASGGKLHFPGDIPSPDEAEAFLAKVTEEYLSE